jgi:uncharacterized protein (TIGR03067 family)
MIWHVFTSLSAALFLVVQVPAEDKAKNDHDRLQGTWKLIYEEVEGKGGKPTNDIRLKFDKAIETEWSAGELATQCSFKIDSTKKPKTLDLTILENRLIPESKGTKIYCIYEFDKNRLKVCYPTMNLRRRPKEFATKEGNEAVLHIYEKIKP